MPALLVAGILISCKNDLEQVAAVNVDNTGPERITYNAEYFYSDSGIVSNRLVASRVEMYKGDSNYTRLANGMELTFYGPADKGNSVLTANDGLIFQNAGRMEVFNNVQFINQKGEKLNTEKLIWDQDSGRVYTDQFVRITRAQDTIYGKGLVANEDMSWYKLTGVTGRFTVKDEE